MEREYEYTAMFFERNENGLHSYTEILWAKNKKDAIKTAKNIAKQKDVRFVELRTS